jgi:hypothetical protein
MEASAAGSSPYSVGSFIAFFFTPAGADTGETPDEVLAYAAANEDRIIGGIFWGSRR